MQLHPSSCLAVVSPLTLDMGFCSFFWVGFNILLLMIVQQLVVILMFSKEKVSVRASTLPS